MSDSIFQEIINYFQDNRQSFLLAVNEHLRISIIALFIAVLIGVPLGYLCTRKKIYKKVMVGLFQVLRIIPSLAILFLLVPIVGTGVEPAMIALVLLAVPPILMNTFTAFESVPEFMVETAMGLGMTDFDALIKVKIPLALPVIMAGIRTAAIEIIASATLAAKIGAGGLGQLIFTGLGLNKAHLLIIGGVSVAAISLIVGLLMSLLNRHLFKYAQ